MKSEKEKKTGRPRIDGKNRTVLSTYILEETYKKILIHSEENSRSVSREASLALEEIYRAK